MVALKKQWQQQRLQRQQELAQRQQHVRETLATFHQDRQAMRSHLRDDLSLFQLDLQKNTHDFLDRLSRQRHVLSEQLVQELRAFVETLQAETAYVLSVMAAERIQKAEQLTQDLQHFYEHLRMSVAALRGRLGAHLLEIREEIWVIRADTHAYLEVQRQEQIRVRANLISELQAYVDALHLEVSDYLFNLEYLRQERSQQIQDEFQQQREIRMLEMDALFRELAEFRAYLRDYRADLHRVVWGDETISSEEGPSVSPNHPSPSGSQPAVNLAQEIPAPASVSDHPQAQALNVANIGQVLGGERVPTSQNGSIPTLVVSSGLITPIGSTQHDSEHLEEDIFTFIHESGGARLTAIESALGMNRFQAVNALRSLIKKGMVTQRDRVYLVQEDINL
ncbi:MAG: gas vesicle protein GvpC [Elainellaceae cyanobacterium]